MRKRLFFILFLSLFLHENAFGQQEKKLPLRLKISILEIDKSGKSFSIKAKLSNVSGEKIVIDKNSIGYAQNFSADYGVFSSRREAGEGYGGQYLILKPNQTFTETKIIEVNDKFFNIDRRYKLSVTYGQFLNNLYDGIKIWRGAIESNQIVFDMKDWKLFQHKK